MSTDIPPPPAELVELMEGEFPPQRAFRFRRQAWLDEMQHIEGAAEAINSLPDAVDRGIIRRAVADLAESNVAGAFIVAMIWGHGLSNLGPHRTLKVLTDDFTTDGSLSDTVATKLRQSCDIARDQGSVEGFRYLANEGKMVWLGASFFTKWLYYVTATGPAGHQGAAPILDKVVIKWLAGHDITIKSNRTKQFERYIEILTAWGAPCDLAPADVEERIFRIPRNDGVS